MEEEILAGIVLIVLAGAALLPPIDDLGGGDVDHCGSTRLTIPEKLLEEGIGSGTANGVALVPANENVFMAETLPLITVPIRIPTTNVAAIKTVANIVRRRERSRLFLT
jgi:hypothetical protein